MAINTLSDWERTKIHEVVSDDRKLEIIIDLYPDKKLTFNELKEQRNLLGDTLKRLLTCLKEVNLVGVAVASPLTYFLTPTGKDLISRYGE